MYDVTIIGGGWAGFTAAREVAARGLKVCLIEEKLLGGTCLNAGCIPTKSLVQSAKLLLKMQKAGEFGIAADNIRIVMADAHRRQEQVVTGLRDAMKTRLRGIDLRTQHAEIVNARTIRLGDTTIETSALIICTGSEPRALKGLEFDGTKIISSDHALALDTNPPKLLIIGGGSIGCEFASIFSAFGSIVTVAEACNQLLPGADAEIARKLTTSFKKRGITVLTGVDALALDRSLFDVVIVSVGRSPRSEIAARAGVAVESGRIVVDEYLRTSVAGIYAAGDCTGKLMLAHYAAQQGRVAAANAMGEKLACRTVAIPNCVFTSPEIASIGLTEDEAIKRGIAIKTYRFDFRSSGMAYVMGEADGLIKIIVDTHTDVVLGAGVIGPDGCELGGILTLAVQSSMTARHLKNTIFAHPSLAESISEMID